MLPPPPNPTITPPPRPHATTTTHATPAGTGPTPPQGKTPPYLPPPLGPPRVLTVPCHCSRHRANSMVEPGYDSYPPPPCPTHPPTPPPPPLPPNPMAHFITISCHTGTHKSPPTQTHAQPPPPAPRQHKTESAYRPMPLPLARGQQYGWAQPCGSLQLVSRTCQL